MQYFVDSKLGCDRNDGLTPFTPWKSLEKINAATFRPGDEILLAADSVFKGQLHPKGDGTAEAPIRIRSYGGGRKPCIDGCGSHGTREGNFLDGAAVLFFNQNYWEVDGLEITNCNPRFKQLFLHVLEPHTHNEFVKSPNNRYRYGVLIRWDNYGTGHHIYIKNCDIHDINAEMSRFTGEGILVVSTGTEDGVPTNFDDVLLEGNLIEDIDRTGISVWSAWAEGRGIDYHNDLATTSNFYHTTVGPWLGSTNLVIRGNRIYRTAGDAILVNSTIGALIEHNYVEHCCYEMRIGPNAAVWPHNADGTIIQYNEVCYTHGVQDGQAFDIDISCNDSTIRYNYSHDNEGGFLLLMYRTRNNDIHHNISEYDRNGLIWNHENDGGTRIHDNLFYLGMEDVQVFRGPFDSDDWVFENNTFYAMDPDTEIEWRPRAKYNGNNYYNIRTLPDDPNARCEKPDFTPSR
ncbi:MAG: right-handed parallel beta-helix repeat-containing protein [Ruminococcaceae bacterium]|nr:right-handed parallel beta-helix repeat-containing protein [Oscillospiraceae bacterium]